MSMITRSLKRKHSMGVVPKRTVCIIPSYTFSPVAGNSENIVNIYLNPEKGKGIIKPARFFMQVCNLLRTQVGHPPLECIFFDPAKEKDFEKQKGEKFSFIQYAGNVPKSIQEHSEGGYLVSPELKSVIESKVNTAQAGKILSDPEERFKTIQEVLKIKGMNNVKTVKKLNAALEHSIIPTGIVKPQNEEDAIEQIKKLLEEYKDTGIVFQLDKGTGGQGTALLKAEKIKDILNNPNDDMLDTIFGMMNYLRVAKHPLLEHIQKNGLSWQKMVSGQEVCVMFRTNSETRQIELSAAAMILISQKGQHIGNIVVDTKTLDNIPDVKLDEEQKKYFILSCEVMLHTILKLKGYEKGINEIYDADGSHLKAFSNDTFFSVAEDGSIKHEISEFNARPPASARVILSAETSNVSPPFMRLWINDAPMPKDMFDCLQNLGVEKASEFFSKKITPILEKCKGAFIDTFAIEDNSLAKDPNEYFSYRWSIFYPKPDMENKGQKELEVIEDIHKICKDITIDDIHETLGLRRSSRLREASSRPSKRLKTR